MTVTLTILFVTLTLFTWECSTSDRNNGVFTSVASLRRLVNNQQDIITGLIEYLEIEEQRLKELKMLIENKQAEIDRHSSNTEVLLQDVYHPITAYQLVRDWSFISERMNDKSSIHHVNFGSDNLNTAIQLMPSHLDRCGAQKSLIRLQQVYNLTIEELAGGYVWGHASRTNLDGRDFYDIGVLAYEQNRLESSRQWLGEAIRHPMNKFNKRDALYMYGQTYSKVQEWGKASEFVGLALDMDPSNITLQEQYNHLNASAEIYGSVSPFPYTEFHADWELKFEAMCRHDQSIFIRRDTWCEYQAPMLPYVPYKVEIINIDPWVLIYHDIIGDAEADLVKTLATPELIRAFVGDPSQSFASDDRIGKVAWLWDQLGNPFIQKLSKRVQEATGLNTKFNTSFSNSEPFQVVNYGLGGLYAPHVDFYEIKEHLDNVPDFIKGTGDRMATFMFYLSDVVEGGATVFPWLDLYIPATKRSAAFWYNAHRNGTMDLRTQHAGCPVLVGEKWVANKWIRQLGQAFSRPCGPTATSTELESQTAFAGL